MTKVTAVVADKGSVTSMLSKLFIVLSCLILRLRRIGGALAHYSPGGLFFCPKNSFSL